MKDLISVIIPVYNVEKYLSRCVDSIILQTYRNLEIILVDDGSPNRCGKMCDQYAVKDSRIKVIHKINGGLSDTRNVAIDPSYISKSDKCTPWFGYFWSFGLLLRENTNCISLQIST